MNLSENALLVLAEMVATSHSGRAYVEMSPSKELNELVALELVQMSPAIVAKSGPGWREHQRHDRYRVTDAGREKARSE